MITGDAGGHKFKEGLCDCGRRLVDLRWVTKDDVGKPGIAHSGTALLGEIDGIIMLVAKMDQVIARACRW